MSNVVLTIGGRDHTVACAAGEEDHIAALGRLINDKLGTLPGASGKNDSRSLLFAALLLADDLFEMRKAASAPVPAPAPIPEPIASADELEALAERLEAVADALEMTL